MVGASVPRLIRSLRLHPTDSSQVRAQAFPLRHSASAPGLDSHRHPPPPNNSFKPTPHRDVNSVLCATLARCRCPAVGRLNSGVSAAQRFLAQQSGSRFGVTSRQVADPSSLAALAFTSSTGSNSAVLRSALVASSRLVLRGGANNSFKPTPLRGAA